MPTLKVREQISNLPKETCFSPKSGRLPLQVYLKEHVVAYDSTYENKVTRNPKEKKRTTNKLEFCFSQKLNNRNVVNSVFPVSCQRTRRNYNHFPYSSILHIKMWNLLLCLLWQCWWSPGPRHAGKGHWAALSPYFLHSFASHLWINTRSKEVTLT